MSKERFIVCVDSYDGPYDTYEAAEFVARDIVTKFAKGEFAGYKAKSRKAVVAKVVDVVDYRPGDWWSRITGPGAA